MFRGFQLDPGATVAAASKGTCIVDYAKATGMRGQILLCQANHCESALFSARLNTSNTHFHTDELNNVNRKAPNDLENSPGVGQKACMLILIDEGQPQSFY